MILDKTLPEFTFILIDWYFNANFSSISKVGVKHQSINTGTQNYSIHEKMFIQF
jgi:hypothetical protein